MKERLSVTEVNRYLNGNTELKQAVDVAPACQLEVQPLGKGEHNLNYVFAHPETGRRFVLRINVAAQPFHTDQVRYEFDALQALAPSGRTPQAFYVDNSPTAPGLGVLVIEFCDGHELHWDTITTAQLAATAEILADVHAVTAPPDCPLFRPADPLLTLFDECRARYESYLRSPYEDPRITGWTDRILAATERAVDQCRGTLRPDELTHLIHTEPLPSHFLLPPEGNHLTSGAPTATPGWLIDWERPVIGEVAQDVAYIVSSTCTFWDSDHFITDDEKGFFIERYWEAVGGRFTRGSFDTRLDAYLAVTAFRSVTWCCRALTTYAKGSTAHQTEKGASKLPIYLSDEFLASVLESCLAD